MKRFSLRMIVIALVSAVAGAWCATANGEPSPRTLLSWSRILGGETEGHAIAAEEGEDGCVYVVGDTRSPSLSVPGGFDTSLGGSCDAFVAKLSPDGTLIWCTYLGGSGDDHGYDVAFFDRWSSYGYQDVCFVAGTTFSDDFPSSDGSGTDYSGSGDAFVAAISPDGELLWTVLLGGTGEDNGYGICVDEGFISQGWFSVLLAGSTGSADMPFTESENSYSGGASDAFVAIISANVAPSGSGKVQWVRFIGGSDDDCARAVSTVGEITVVGSTSSADFPASTTTHAGGKDAFIVNFRLSYIIGSDTGFQPEIWSVHAFLLGGTGDDEAWDLASHYDYDSEMDMIIVVGISSSIDLPKTQLAGASYQGGEDGFIACFGIDDWFLPRSIHHWSTTYLGGTSDDGIRSIALASRRDLILTGYTHSSDFPTNEGFNTSLGGESDAFVARFRLMYEYPPDLLIGIPYAVLRWATLLGGSGPDAGHGVAVDDKETVFVTGGTRSLDFPATAGDAPSSDDDDSCYVARIRSKRTLTVRSSPVQGILIEGDAGGLTEYSLEFDEYRSVVLIAPRTIQVGSETLAFSGWVIDGTVYSGNHRVSVGTSEWDHVAEVQYSVPASLVIKGPVERGEGPLPPGPGEFDVDIYVSGVTSFAGMNSQLDFVGADGKKTGFTIADEPGNIFGDRRVLHNAELIGSPFCWASDSFFGFMLLTGDLDIPAPTWLLTVTYRYEGGLGGSFAINPNEDETLLADSIPRMIPYLPTPGSVQIIPGISVQSTPLPAVAIAGDRPGLTNYTIQPEEGETVSLNAPLTASSSGNDYFFVRWKFDGQDRPRLENVLSIHMDANAHTAVAVYRLAGDANLDCRVDIWDLLDIRRKLQLGPAPDGSWQADVNGDNRINVLDLIYARNRLNTRCE